MPGTTATQGLIYPEDTDRACDGAEQLQVLAEGINGRLSVLDALVDSAEAPAMVLVEFIADQSDYFHSDALSDDNMAGGAIVWNTVSIDSADAFDSGVSAVSITLPYTAPGQLWEVGCYVMGRWTAGSPGTDIVKATIGLIQRDSLGNTIHWSEEQRFITSSDAALSGSIVAMYETAGADTVSVSWSFVAFDGSEADVLQFAQLWAIKVSEA